MPYTGKDWPYEAFAERSIAEGTCSVLLLGERQDVEGLRDIMASLSSIRAYGRPFAPLYGYEYRRPDKNGVNEWAQPFRHASFSLPLARRDFLLALLAHCPSMCYEIAEQETVMRNFAYEPFGLNAALEAALCERGWSKRRPGFHLSLQQWQDHKKHSKTAEHHTEDRWWHEYRHHWQKRTP